MSRRSLEPGGPVPLRAEKEIRVAFFFLEQKQKLVETGLGTQSGPLQLYAAH